MQEVTIFVGVELDADGITKALTSNADGRTSVQISPIVQVAQVLMAAQRDSRVEIHDVKLQKVQVDLRFSSQVQVDFVVNWSLYHGCKDVDEADEEYASEGATYTADGYLVFRLPDPRRPSSEC